MEPLNLLTPQSAPETARLAIDGMTCGGCAAKVRRTLEALPGVVAASVDLAAARAEVGYDPAHVTVEGIVGAIAALAYDVRPV